MSRKVVFDTTTVVSALLFTDGRLAWLRQHWRERGCVPLISRATAAELLRVFRYPKFGLSLDEARELLADYLPYCEVVEPVEKCACLCRDANDQAFLDLAQSGRADLLISGDQDLLILAGQTTFLIETPEGYRRRVSVADRP
ncbi:MAG: putative toxin-antitoxin system toxin component, PIN family [Candidatus Sulfotelmatobacter sp.]